LTIIGTAVFDENYAYLFETTGKTGDLTQAAIQQYGRRNWSAVPIHRLPAGL